MEREAGNQDTTASRLRTLEGVRLCHGHSSAGSEQSGRGRSWGPRAGWLLRLGVLPWALGLPLTGRVSVGGGTGEVGAC